MEYARRVGIQKTRGGESGGSHSFDSSKVSFWHSPEGNGTISPGFGPRESFEYPITFAVGENHYKDPNSYNPFGTTRGNRLGPLRGEMAGEAKVGLFWPIECIDYIFVPLFAVNATYKILEEHGLTHIKVLPYTRELQTQGEILKQIFSLEGQKSDLLYRDREEISFSTFSNLEPDPQVIAIDEKLSELKKKVSKQHLKLVQELVEVLDDLKSHKHAVENAILSKKSGSFLNIELPETISYVKRTINELEKRQAELEKQLKEI